MILSTEDELTLNAGKQQTVKDELLKLQEARNEVLKPMEQQISRGLRAATGRIFRLDGKGNFTHYIGDASYSGRTIETLLDANINVRVEGPDFQQNIVIDTTQPGFLVNVKALKQASEEITR